MDPMAILAGIKGKVLDAHHFDLLKSAYEIQNQNIEQLKTNNEAIRESNELLRDKVAEQKKEIELLNATIEEHKSRVRGQAETGTLTQDEEKILVFLSTQIGRERPYNPLDGSSYSGPTSQEIASHLGLNLTRTEHYLERMWRKYVNSHDWTDGRPSQYSLSQGGKAYLVENGLVE